MAAAPALTNSAGVPWTAAYIDTIGEPTADLRSNIAAEARAKIVYERLINITDDPGIKEALGFLMTREIAHQKSFEKALYSIEPNFPPGKLPGMPEFANMYCQYVAGRRGRERAMEFRASMEAAGKRRRQHSARWRRWARDRQAERQGEEGHHGARRAYAVQSGGRSGDRGRPRSGTGRRHDDAGQDGSEKGVSPERAPA